MQWSVTKMTSVSLQKTEMQLCLNASSSVSPKNKAQSEKIKVPKKLVRRSTAILPKVGTAVDRKYHKVFQAFVIIVNVIRITFLLTDSTHEIRSSIMANLNPQDSKVTAAQRFCKYLSDPSVNRTSRFSSADGTNPLGTVRQLFDQGTSSQMSQQYIEKIGSRLEGGHFFSVTGRVIGDPVRNISNTYLDVRDHLQGANRDYWGMFASVSEEGYKLSANNVRASTSTLNQSYEEIKSAIENNTISLEQMLPVQLAPFTGASGAVLYVTTASRSQINESDSGSAVLVDKAVGSYQFRMQSTDFVTKSTILYRHMMQSNSTDSMSCELNSASSLPFRSLWGRYQAPLTSDGWMKSAQSALDADSQNYYIVCEATEEGNYAIEKVTLLDEPDEKPVALISLSTIMLRTKSQIVFSKDLLLSIRQDTMANTASILEQASVFVVPEIGTLESTPEQYLLIDTRSNREKTSFLWVVFIAFIILRSRMTRYGLFTAIHLITESPVALCIGLLQYAFTSGTYQMSILYVTRYGDYTLNNYFLALVWLYIQIRVALIVGLLLIKPVAALVKLPSGVSITTTTRGDVLAFVALVVAHGYFLTTSSSTSSVAGINSTETSNGFAETTALLTISIPLSIASLILTMFIERKDNPSGLKQHITKQVLVVFTPAIRDARVSAVPDKVTGRYQLASLVSVESIELMTLFYGLKGASQLQGGVLAQLTPAGEFQITDQSLYYPKFAEAFVIAGYTTDPPPLRIKQ